VILILQQGWLNLDWALPFRKTFQNMFTISERALKLGLAAWFLITMISQSIYLGGVSDQLTFGSKICLLFVENYRKDDSMKVWIFDAFSPSCGSAISMGSIGLFLLFVITIIRGYFIYKKEEPSRNVIMGLAVTGTFWAFVSLIMASILSAGVAKTCSEFTKSGKTCGAVFGEGFFADITSLIYYKNINTVNATVGAGWMTFVSWAVYGAFEWYSYRHSSLKWW
jgi:hypothetical protein